jgi:hypothetical protein
VRFYPKYNELKGLVGAKFYASNAEGLGKTQVASVDTEPTGGWNSYEIDLDTPVSRVWLEVERADGAGWHCHVTELAFNGIQVFASPACPIVVNTHAPPNHFSFGQVVSSFTERPLAPCPFPQSCPSVCRVCACPPEHSTVGHTLDRRRFAPNLCLC